MEVGFPVGVVTRRAADVAAGVGVQAEVEAEEGAGVADVEEDAVSVPPR